MTMGEKSPLRARDLSIDSLRGMAVILMVAGHVIGSDAGRGMLVNDGSSWRLSYLVLEDIRMPLFTVLSGFVYAHRPLPGFDRFPGMVRGKARRLLIPMVTVGTLFFVMQLLVPGTNEKPELDQFWRIFVYGFAHLWFLQAIFLIFLIAAVLNATRVLDSVRGWSIAFGASCAVFVAVELSGPFNVFSASGAIRLLPFFLLGYALNRLPALWRREDVFPAILVIAGSTLTARLLFIAGHFELPGALDRLLSLAVGASFVVLLVFLRDHIRIGVLAWLGPYSFGIYLLHVFGAAGSRIALSRVGLDIEIVVFVVCLAVAVGAPVIAEKLLGKYGWFSWGFLGQKPRRELPAPVNPWRRQPV